MSRIRVKILTPISGPYGTYISDENGKFLRWKYCRNINGKWYFEMYQSFNEINNEQ